MIIIILVVLFFLPIFYFTNRSKKEKNLLNTVTKTHRGTRTERELVLKLLKAGFPDQTIFHDLYLQNKFGNYSQIDLVLATKVGIIVFEVKEYSGWIFGSGKQEKWTQVLAYGKKKYYFYNPILQNKKHVENLKAKLTDFQNIPFYSIVVFYGNCEFRDVRYIPNGTFLVKSHRVIEVVNKIINENEIANYKSKRDVVNVLSTAVENGNNHDISEKHVKNIKDMLGDERVFN